MKTTKKITCNRINLQRNSSEKTSFYVDDFFTTPDHAGCGYTTITGLCIYVWNELPSVTASENNKNWFIKDHYVAIRNSQI